MNPPLNAFYLKNALSPCIGRILYLSTSAGSPKGAITACLPSAGSSTSTGAIADGTGTIAADSPSAAFGSTVQFIIAAIRRGPAIELLAMAGCLVDLPDQHAHSSKSCTCFKKLLHAAESNL